MNSAEIATELVVSRAPEELRESLIVGLPCERDLDDTSLAGIDKATGGLLSAALRRGDFTGRLKQTVFLFNQQASGPRRIVLVGLGDAASYSEESARKAMASALKLAAHSPIKRVGIELRSFALGEISMIRAGELAAEVSQLALWRDYTFQTEIADENKRTLETVELLWPDDEKESDAAEAIRRSEITAKGTCFARELVGRPGNELYPAILAQEAREIATRHKFGVEVFGATELDKMGLHTLLAVGAGSVNPPYLIVIDTAPGSKESPIALVGKGVTFDSGGISIKPASKMEEMKGDMAGAAAVLAAIDVLGQIGLSKRVVGIVPAVENMPGSTAQRPGDIWKSYAGINVEVINTDAEGRLALADAVAYAVRQYKPSCVIDIATLTGACFIALGDVVCGLLGNDDSLCNAIFEAGERTYERVWRLPLYSEYDELLKSDIADIKNVGGRGAGTITGAAFIKRFVGSIPWAHLDIAATSWLEKAGDFMPKGPTGFGVRLLVETLTRQLDG